MSQRYFFILLFLVTLLTACGVFYSVRLAQLAPFSDFTWFSLFFFTILSVIMYYAGAKAAGSSNKYAFINTVLGFTVGKLFFSAAIILIYFKLAAPDNRLFILPFFGVYLIYTVFETFFMMKLGKQSI